MGENLNSYKVVVTKSTVPAGTGTMVRDIIEEHSTEDHPFSVASNPEFLREGSAIEDFMRPNRVVLGTEDEHAAAILQDLYRPLYLIETPIVVTDVVSRRGDQVRLQRLSGDQDLVHQRDGRSVRGGRARTCTSWPRAWGSTGASVRSSCTPVRATAAPAFPRTPGRSWSWPGIAGTDLQIVAR